jgi:hypothetical protein
MKLPQLFFTLLTSALVAQASPPPAEPDISVTFTVVGWTDKVTDTLGYRKNGTIEKLVIPAYQRSASYAYTGSRKMELFRIPVETRTSIASDKNKPLPIATVIFPASLKKATVLLTPSGAGYNSIVIADDLDQFPVGKALLLNLTRGHIGVFCNKKEPIVLGSNQHQLASPDARGVLDTIIAQENNGRWQAMERNYLTVLPGQQTAIIIYTNPAISNSPLVVTLRQTPPTESAPQG